MKSYFNSLTILKSSKSIISTPRKTRRLFNRILRDFNRNLFIIILSLYFFIACTEVQDSKDNYHLEINPTTLIWYGQPADKWDNAFPVGNGRLGAMVFGNTDVERIQFNEETYWSGGPYNQTRKGGYKYLPRIQELIFKKEYTKAHNLFGRYLLGYPVEQMKYQSLGDLILKFSNNGEIKNYRHQLNLDEAIITTEYEQRGIIYKREVFVSPVDQVIVIHLTSNKPESISFVANLRGCRNTAHSNYGTGYFQMDGYGNDGLILTGKSADYLGVDGEMRYRAQVKTVQAGGSVRVEERDLFINNADSITLYIAASTNFVNYKDVSADPIQRVEKTFYALGDKSYEKIKSDHIREHQKLFRRVSLDLGSTENSYLATDKRRENFEGRNDPNLAALAFQYGRYLLISSSRPGTQPANLQGIWNEDMNPSWDSKYTTNINTEMNYWPAEVGNLSECAEPLFQMISELTDQGTDVAREHYGKKGWVFHQNTDQWRVAAPMDGTQWGTFTTGGTWLCTHIWEHYLYTGDKEFLKKYYPVLKGNVEFFLDFLLKHPKYGWLVTNPSTSPENFPGRPGNDTFFDEATAWNSPGTTICAGSTIDMQLLSDFFYYFAETSTILNLDENLRAKVLNTIKQLAPIQIGKNGDLQEWLEDWPQKEKSHRHISNLYGLFPGNQISARWTPDLAEAAKVVLEQRGLEGNGWASAWKMACWARLYNPQKAMDNFEYYIHNYSFNNLFAICANALQVDGSFGVTAAVAEMLIQSHEGELYLLPSLPDAWPKGEINGLRARGGFEVDMKWENRQIISGSIVSLLGKNCRIRTGSPIEIFADGRKIPFNVISGELVEFETTVGGIYEIKSITSN